MRGSPTAMPADWIPVKTKRGWTAVQLRDDGNGFTVLKDGEGQIRFWSRRFRMTNELTSWALLTELETLRRKVAHYESQAPLVGSIA